MYLYVLNSMIQGTSDILLRHKSSNMQFKISILRIYFIQFLACNDYFRIIYK